ncbi:MAG: tetratricopeptide repeat protein [Candidatus Cloacimonetes bacterium]|nr:tetratricopeptide repeat protein [Candidatus Cloacimonadota bacterium]
MKRIIVLFVMVLFVSVSLCAQNVTLLFKEKKTFSKEKVLSISLCDQNGNEPVTEEEFIQSDMLYFAYKPIGEWEFKEKDLDEDVATIYIKQQGVRIDQQEINAQTFDGKINQVITAYPKRNFNLAEPFSFHNELTNSQPMILPEKFWIDYDAFRNAYTKGADLADQEQYLESFSALTCFLSNTPEVEGLSFHRLTLQLVTNDVRILINETQSEFNILKLELIKSLNETTLGQLDDLYSQALTLQDSFSVYFDYMNNAESNNLHNKLDTLVQESGDLLQQYTDEFKLQKLTIFEKGHYSDNRFAYYIDLLSRMLCYSDSIHMIDSLHPMNIETVNNFPEQKNRLELLEWLDDFLAGITLINRSIERDQCVLCDSAMMNLKAQLLIEKQPYYEIVTAFNELGSQERDAFAQNISAACVKCTDEELLDLLELQYLSWLATNSNISETVLSAINNGLEYEKAGNIVDAEQQFTKATLLASNYAPPQFYLGRIYHQKDEKYTAEIYFQRALEISPTYISPMKYMIDFLIEDGSYQEALDQVNTALESNPIWFFHYLKALALYHLGQYAEAGNVLNEAIRINGFDFDEYILLGDIYKGQENIDRAKEAYSNAGKIDPTNKIFTERMASLKK